MLTIEISGKTIPELKTNMENCLRDLTFKTEEKVEGPSKSFIEEVTKSMGIEVKPLVGSADLTGTVSNIPVDVSVTQQPVIKSAQQVLDDHVSAPSVESGQNVDKNGLPWDERIHAMSKTKTVKNLWKYRRGIEDDLKHRVEVELREKAMQPPIEIPTVPVVTTVQPIPQVIDAANANANANAVARRDLMPLPVDKPVAPQIPTDINSNIGHTLETFKNNVVMTLSQLIEEGKINLEYLTQLKNHFGVSEFWEMTDVQFQEMFDTFSHSGLITKVG